MFRAARVLSLSALVTLAVAAAATAGSCDSNSSGSGDGGGRVDLGPGGCTIPGVGPMCGQSCTGDTDCGDALYCQSGMCVAQCTSASPCPAGYLCDHGRCLGIKDPSGCSNLSCRQVDCTGTPGGPTTVTGKVYAPNGTLPLYNAIVYVPNAPLQSIPEGVTCDVCGALQSGSPITATLTGTDGSFTLTDVPAGTDLPLVIQLGKWRREVTLPKVEACQTQAITDPMVTRLPRTKAEGNLPQMAIATGNADPFECLLRKIGIADSEITLPSQNGRVHFYHLNGRNMNPAAPQANDATNGLYVSLAKLKTYDVVMLPCEGTPTLSNKSDPQLKNIVDYAAAGGRVFTTHYSYVWLQKTTDNEPNPPFPGIATWEVNRPDPTTPFFGTIDTSFPKGMAFAEWLRNVNALVATGANAGKLDIKQPQHSLKSVIDPPSKRWIYSDTGNQPKITQHFTFNTPLTNQPIDDGGMPYQCGRVVFSDFHVSAGATQPGSFPMSCKNEDLTPEEKALAFMLFDLSSCVQNDNVEPPIP